MRVIDLLNKIANGEELPRKLKGNNHTYTLVENRNYEDEDGDILFSDDYFWCNEDFLNKELEIIEEDKEIEKIDRVNGSYLIDLRSDSSIAEQSEAITSLVMYLNNNADKINELVKAVNELKKGK